MSAWTKFVADDAKYKRIVHAAGGAIDDDILLKAKLRLACLGACQALAKGATDKQAREQAKQQFETFGVPLPPKLGIFLQATGAPPMTSQATRA